MIRAMLRLFTLRRRRWRELFSLAIDERLSDAEAAELERILDRSQEARKEFEEMKASVTALRAAPQVEPTRSFRLTPDMVEAPAPEPVRRLPAFVPAAAGAAALLVFAIIGGTLGLFGGGPSGQESPPLAAAPPGVTAAPAPTAESLGVTAMAPTAAPASTPAPEATHPRVTAMAAATSAPTPAPTMMVATAMPAPAATSAPTPATALRVTAMPAPTAASAPLATATPAAIRAVDTPSPEAMSAPKDEPTAAPMMVAATSAETPSPTTPPVSTAVPPTGTATPTAAVVVVAVTPTMQNIETDMTSPDPDLSGVSQEAIEAIVKEYVDANRESLRGPPGRSGTDGTDGENDEPGPPGPRGATGGEGSQGPQGEQGLHGVAGPRGATGGWRARPARRHGPAGIGRRFPLAAAADRGGRAPCREPCVWRVVVPAAAMSRRR